MSRIFVNDTDRISAVNEMSMEHLSIVTEIGLISDLQINDGKIVGFVLNKKESIDG